MEIRLPLWVLLRVIQKNPWLLSSSGCVSKSLIIDFLWWEITLDSSWELLPEGRKRLLEERDARASKEDLQGMD